MNRRARRIFSVLVAAALTVTSLSVYTFASVSGSSSSSSSSRISYARIRVNPTRMSLSVGQSSSLDYELYDEYGDYTGGVSWSSSDSWVAEVSSSGTVTANRPGIVTITARTSSGSSASCEVAVTGRLYPGDPYYDYYDGYIPNNPWDYRYYNSSRSSSSSSSTRTSSTASRTARTTRGSTVTLSDRISRETVVNEVRGLNTGGYATFKNYASVSAETLQAAWDTKDCTLQFDTTLSGGSVIGRLSIKTADASKFTGDVYTGVYVDVQNTAAVVQTFSTYFTNRTKVVRSDQSSFPAAVEYAVKADNMSANSLYFYTYNQSTNRYNPITVSNVFKDPNEYIHFTTTYGGYIIISDGPLSAI